MYTHIRRDQRVALAALLRAGYSQRSAAREIDTHPSTVCRELKRNTDLRYHATHADLLARKRRRESKVRYRKIETDPRLARRIEHMLEPLVSPEVVAHTVGIAHGTIYAWIDRSRQDLLPKLPYRGKKRRRYGGNREAKQGWTKGVPSIRDRTESALSWEGDTVVGSTKTRLLTHVERTSLYTRADILPDGTADRVHATLKQSPLSGVITYDRGSEFALWRMIEKDTSATVFFADPHSPWQRGKNENTNGRLRRVFPKRFDFSTITKRHLDRVVSKMNHTPRKSLSWKTPAEVFKELCCTSS